MTNFYPQTEQLSGPEVNTGTYQFRPDALVIRTLINPLRLTRILIQLGHEPLPPNISPSPLSLIGLPHSTVSCYPNVFVYTRHLFHTYGFWPVMTCGFFSTLCLDLLTEAYYFMSRRYLVERALNAGEWLEDGDIIETSKPRFGEGVMERIPLSQFAVHLLSLCFLKIHEVFVTQPFYVIMVRQGASIVGKEVGYSWFYQAVLSIFRDNGITGFFSGITPRLIFELSSMILHLSVSRLLQANLFGSFRSWSKAVRNCIHTLFYAVISFLAYRLEMNTNHYVLDTLLLEYGIECRCFLQRCEGDASSEQVISCVMALHGSRISTMEAAVANRFSNWRECKRTLAMAGELQRGYFPFWRFCPSPSLSALGSLHSNLTVW
ncbi:unnamed protein product [Taenia asiatica]|uniref:Mitochondrial carrier homolog 2 n=1 Tax=Taenia asiatica TaxID=60517 RepID=A0A0R3W2Q2_TAEAS|nr:unnamed protein product [Taenia asiatica]